MDGVIRMSRACGVCIRRGTHTRHQTPGQTPRLRGVTTVTLTLASSGQSRVTRDRTGPPFRGVAWPPDDSGHDITDNIVFPFVLAWAACIYLG